MCSLPQSDDFLPVNALFYYLILQRLIAQQAFHYQNKSGQVEILFKIYPLRVSTVKNSEKTAETVPIIKQ